MLYFDGSEFLSRHCVRSISPVPIDYVWWLLIGVSQVGRKGGYTIRRFISIVPSDASCPMLCVTRVCCSAARIYVAVVFFCVVYKFAFPSFGRFEGPQYRPAFSVLGPKMRVSSASCKAFRIFGSCCFSLCLSGRVAGCRFSPACTSLWILRFNPYLCFELGWPFFYVTACFFFVSTLDSSFRSSACYRTL